MYRQHPLQMRTPASLTLFSFINFLLFIDNFLLFILFILIRKTRQSKQGLRPPQQQYPPRRSSSSVAFAATLDYKSTLTHLIICLLWLHRLGALHRLAPMVYPSSPLTRHLFHLYRRPTSLPKLLVGTERIGYPKSPHLQTLTSHIHPLQAN